jgi:hypothetical protein
MKLRNIVLPLSFCLLFPAALLFAGDTNSNALAGVLHEAEQEYLQIGSGITNELFTGKWSAYSRNHMAISGNMIVSQNDIVFAKKGKVTFDVIRYDGKEYILKIDKNVDDGLFMRIGIFSSSEIEVAYYTSKEAAKKNTDARLQKANESFKWFLNVKNHPMPAPLHNPKPPLALLARKATSYPFSSCGASWRPTGPVPH